MNRLNIGVVGGSLAGCTAAILLQREGHSVQVFERSRGGLVGRGGGIATTGQVLQAMLDQDIVDPDFPHLTGKGMPFIVRTPEHERTGYAPLELPLNLEAFHWATLWNTLRKRVPDESYHQGSTVVHAETTAEPTGVLHFEDGTVAEFDLVVFADGYSSLGRRLLFPDSEPVYRGYVLWRGLLPESEIDDSAPLEGMVPRLSYASHQGNLVVYFVPGLDGSTEVGRRLFNWAAYIPVAEESLPQFMRGKDGTVHAGTIPPGQMRLEEENRLKQLMVENLPTYYGEIISRSVDTYVQLIYTASMPAYHRGRMCLIGDAGFVAQPFTGSGVFKGYNNIKDLLVALKEYGSVDDALAHWGADQVARGERLLKLGMQMEQAFIWNPLDLSTADEASTKAWWTAAVTYPEEFSLEK